MPSTDKRDYYDRLGISKTATVKEIKTAWRNKARDIHPDTAPESEKKAIEEKLKDINEAKEVLFDPEKRKQYDRLGHIAWVDKGRPPPSGPSRGHGHPYGESGRDAYGRTSYRDERRNAPPPRSAPGGNKRASYEGAYDPPPRGGYGYEGHAAYGEDRGTLFFNDSPINKGHVTLGSAFTLVGSVFINHANTRITHKRLRGEEISFTDRAYQLGAYAATAAAIALTVCAALGGYKNAKTLFRSI